MAVAVSAMLTITCVAAPYQNYTYTESGIYPEPQAIVPDKVINSNTIGIENLGGVALSNPQDLVQFDLTEFVIISDTGNNRIVVLDKDMRTVKQIISSWYNKGKEDTFNSPNGLFMYDNDEYFLYVCDTTNKRVVRFAYDTETQLFSFDRTYDDPDISKYFTQTDGSIIPETPAPTATPVPEDNSIDGEATPEATPAAGEAEVGDNTGEGAGTVTDATPASEEGGATDEGGATGAADTTPAPGGSSSSSSSSSSATDVSYKPLKIVVDNAMRMFVVSKDCYQGLVELDSNGEFTKFFGATKTKQSLSALLSRMFTANAKKKLQQNLSTEYSNVTMDNEGFIYGTISQIKLADIMAHYSTNSEVGAALRKLNAAGSDVLQRQGLTPPSGDAGDKMNRSTYSYIVDVTVSQNGLSSILDSQKGRVFTYSSTGELLYVFGALGRRQNNTGTEVSTSREDQVGFTKGTSLNPVAIELLKDDETLVILDSAGAQMTTYVPTEYGTILREAVNSHEERRYSDAVEAWNKILGMSSNSSIAYRGVGKVKYMEASEELDSDKQRAGYLEAADYFMKGYSQDEYGKAFYKYRDKVLEDIMPYLLTVIIAIAVITIVIGWTKKFRHFVKTGGKHE